MSQKSFLYPPSNPLVGRAIRRLAIEQWAKWQSSRTKAGVTWGHSELPGKSHPDVSEEFNNLPPHIADFALSLTYGRVMLFALIGWEKVSQLITAVREGTEIPQELTEEVACGFHQGWWLQRQAWSLSGHSGDKSWEEENEAEQANDLKLVPGWAELLSACDLSEDEELQALMRFLRGE